MTIPRPFTGPSKLWWWALPGAFWAALVVTSLLWNLAEARNRSLDLTLHATRAFFQQIQTAREWNARHGGVYVPVTEDTRPNPYLDDPDRDVTTLSGLRLTKINPAFMTRQIAEIAATEKGVRFHITSLKPIRPANTPDPWEVSALEAIERGKPEVLELLDSPERGPVFRYMAGLYTGRSCLKCHEKHGYALGEVRGGISVEIDAEPTLAANRVLRRNLFGVHAGILVLGVCAMLAFARYHRRQWIALETSKQRAETASLAKSSFLANISHELRTPLHSVLGFADLLLDEVDGPINREQRQSLRRVTGNAQQLLHLINEVLDLSRIEADRIDLDLAPFSLREAIRETIQMFRLPSERKGLRLAYSVAGDVPDILVGDSSRLRQVLSNLTDNAIKFTEQGGVSVSVEKDPQAEGEGCLHFAVNDTGIGIAPHQQGRIFEPFIQGDGSATREHGGAGLGLAICTHLVRMMGGRLWVESEPGEGSTFHFTARFGS